MVHYFGVFDPGPVVRQGGVEAPAKAPLFSGKRGVLSLRFWKEQFSRLGRPGVRSKPC
jgi:hypothetical protein